MDELAGLGTQRMIARKEGSTGWMLFNNPARHNAVSLEMWEAMPRILAGFEADDAIRCIILGGAGGKAFVSGADISKFGENRSTPELVKASDARSEAANRALRECPKPTIAMIRGYCIGGGVAVALACDLRIAGQGSRFGVPAARLGLGYRMTGVKKLVDIVGPAFAKEIFFTARQFTAEEAFAMGLVNRVVPQAELETYVADYARRIADNAPLTVNSIKRIVGEVLKDPEARDLALCDRLVRECFESVDYAEGRRAFMEKRKPVFAGR